MTMGVNTVESDLDHLVHVSVETETGGNSSLSQKENGKLNKDLVTNELIKFGSHGPDESNKKEVTNLPENNFPKDAADEWPAPKEVHSFYIVKYRSYDDQKLKVKLDQAEKELKRLNQATSQIKEKLRAKKADRAQVIVQLKSVGEETKQFRLIMDEKRKEMEPLQQALGKLRTSNTGGRERSFICSSEEELNDVIKSLQYRIQHESIPLTEEKQIIREIKQLEGTRDKVIANVARRAEVQDAFGEKEAIQDQIKLIGVDLDGVRKDRQVVKAKVKQLEDEKEPIEKAIHALQEELRIMTEKWQKALEKLQELRQQSERGNASYHQNRKLLTGARQLAAKKDVDALKELVDAEVDKFISLWSCNTAFRDDYERRILPSLDMRQLSRDGRMRNPDEKPPVVQEPSTPSEAKTVAKPNLKQPKEDSRDSTIQKEKSTKQQKEADNEVKGPESTIEQSGIKDKDGISGMEKLENDPPKRNEVDEVKLKELKREEEMAKAKQALERKKKLAEKAAAKAAVKAQKETEKKLKDREKKAKKKAAASVPIAPEEPTEADDEVDEAEKAEGIVHTAVPSKTKERKDNAVRHRGRAKGPDSLQKIILKRKKSANYWVWAAPAALLVVMLAVIWYYYLL